MYIYIYLKSYFTVTIRNTINIIAYFWSQVNP